MPFISEVPPIFVQRFYTGWITLRNQLATPIRTMGRRIIELYDALIAGNDWEVTPLLSLKRRAGHTAYVTVNYAALALYSWKSNTQGTIPIIDTLSDIEYVNGAAVTAITTKGATSGQGLQSSILGIGNFLYVGNPQVNFKWDGPAGAQGKTNWGIANAQGSAGPDTAGTGTSVGSHVTSWVNPGNVSSAVSYATLARGAANVDALSATNFGFSVPLATAISGIVVRFNLGMTPASTSGNLQVFLLKGGVAVGSAKLIPSSSIPTSPGSFTLGLSTDLWGATLTANDVNASTFGVIFSASTIPFTPPEALSINNVQITVYEGVIPVATPTGTGTFSAVNGFSYVTAYGNATSGEISNATLVSVNTGPFTSKAYVGIPVTASTDTQVNQIHVYRTTDSGGGNQFFEIVNSPFPNTNATIQDTTPDTQLQVTSQAEINLGNTPPPTGLINLEWFAGRMWGSTGSTLWASTGPETISGTAPNSNWNPEFQWVIPQPVIRNVRGPNGMLVFTVDDCYIVRGTDIVNYTVNEFVKDFGVRTYNAIDTDGTNIFVFTSDRQFVQVTASGAVDIGLPIADQLLNVDPTQVYVKVNRYGLDSIVRILDTVNNIYYDFNLNQQCWNLPGILAMPSCSAMGSMEVSPGVWRLLLCSTSSGISQLAYRDINNFLDLGTTYAPAAVFGSIQLADPGNLAKFGALGGFVLEFTNAGTLPLLSVLPNDIGATLSNALVAVGYGVGGYGGGGYGGNSQITGNFTALSGVGPNPIKWPPTLSAQPVNYRSVGYYYMYGKSLSGFVRHIQFMLNAKAENAPTELVGFGIFGDLKQESPQAGQLPQLQGR